MNTLPRRRIADNAEVVPFGKYRGELVMSLPLEYGIWLLSKLYIKGRWPILARAVARQVAVNLTEFANTPPGDPGEFMRHWQRESRRRYQEKVQQRVVEQQQQQQQHQAPRLVQHPRVVPHPQGLDLV